MESVVLNWKSVTKKVIVCLISMTLLFILISIKHRAVSFVNRNIIYLYLIISSLIIVSAPIPSSNRNYVFYYQKIDFVTVLLVCVLLIQFFFSFFFFKATVDGNSMNPTLLDGETLVVRVTKRVERGDVVVIYIDKDVNTLSNGVKDDELLVKRVIGVSGDNVYAKDGIIYINDEPITDYTSIETHNFDFESIIERTKTIDGVTKIPDGYILVLGDNRTRSNDSRYIGLFSKDQILGKVLYKKGKSIVDWMKIE